MALNLRQTAFVAAYLQRPNATKAAIKAGYSERSAHEIGSKLLKNVEIVEAIRLERERILNVDVDSVRREIAAVAMADLRDVTEWGVRKVKIGFDADGRRLPPDQIMDAVTVIEVDEPHIRPVDSDELPAHIAAAVSEVSLGKEGFKIKMHSKLQALDMLSKMLGYYAPERHEITGPGGKPIELDANVSPAEAYQKMLGGN